MGTTIFLQKDKRCKNHEQFRYTNSCAGHWLEKNLFLQSKGIENFFLYKDGKRTEEVDGIKVTIYGSKAPAKILY